MANLARRWLSSSNARHVLCFLMLLAVTCGQNVVFQPSFITATGPIVSGLLTGNTSGVSLSLRTVTPSNITGTIGPPSCASEATQWVLTKEQIGNTVTTVCVSDLSSIIIAAIRVKLSLNRSLHLCGENETDTDCCPKPLCVLETLQVSACVRGEPQASLLIQAEISALVIPSNPGADNKTVIPNQVFQPLGSCPCDLTLRKCDIRCCCDKDCSAEELKLFESHCFLGPFGGQVSPVPDYHCSAQTSQNSPDWFPFLCVISPPENNPFLGLFYQGDKITPKPGPSFQLSILPAPVPVDNYVQGSPIFTSSDQYFTIPQMALGRCVNNGPVAFLKNFNVKCVTLLRSCPTGFPLETQPADLRIQVKNGQGGDVTVNVTDESITDLSQFVTSAAAADSAVGGQVCEKVTFALDYKFYWKGNAITGIALTRTLGNISFNDNVEITTRYSAVFLNGEFMGEPNSGNPGYQVGRPVIGGIMNLENYTDSIQRLPLNLWKPVNDGVCSTAERRPVLFGENSTSGCLFPVSLQNVSQCNLLRETVDTLQGALITATYIAKSGNPDSLAMADWTNITFVTVNSSTALEDSPSSCSGIPSHVHYQVWSLDRGRIDGKPQWEIQALQVSFSLSTWALECGGGDISPCIDPEQAQYFPITSSVTFIEIPVNIGPPKTRFQLNFTEYDCNRNDVCWPELGFPLTKYYTGEPYSQALAKGLILVFFFIAASVLGTPWRQIRQAWKSAAL